MRFADEPGGGHISFVAGEDRQNTGSDMKIDNPVGDHGHPRHPRWLAFEDRPSPWPQGGQPAP